MRTINLLLGHFAPQGPEVSNDGKWAICVSNNAAFLQDVSIVVPMSFALSFARRVHPLDPVSFLKTIKLVNRGEDDESETLPLGIDGLINTGLVVFKNVNRAPKQFEYYSAQAAFFFEAWSKPWVSLLMTVAYNDTWQGEAEKQFLDSISFAYGESTRSYILSRAELFIIHDSGLPDKLKRKYV